MPNESSGRNHQVRQGHFLRQDDPSWGSLLHNVSTSVKLFLFILLSPGHWFIHFQPILLNFPEKTPCK